MKLLHHTKVPLSEAGTKYLVRGGIAPSPRLRGSKRRCIEPLDAVHRVMTRLAPGIEITWDAVHPRRQPTLGSRVLHENRERVAAVVLGDAGDLPTTQDSLHKTVRTCQPLPAPTHRQFVDVVDQESVPVLKRVIAVVGGQIMGVLRRGIRAPLVKSLVQSYSVRNINPRARRFWISSCIW